MLNKLLKFIIIVSIVSTLNCAACERIILHFDVNKTLIAYDSIENETIFEIINSLLAEKYIAVWDANSSEMSFHDYVFQVKFPDDYEGDVNSIRDHYIHNFVDYLKQTQHPLYETVNQEYRAIEAKMALQHGQIFQSFYKLIAFLEANQIEYSIFLRSFGNDLGSVAKEINKELNVEFFGMKASFKNGNLVTENGELTDRANIYNFLKNQKNLIIQDDWQWWSSHQKLSQCGKKYYVRLDDQVIQIFFDDNIRINSNDKNIIGPINVDTDELLNIDDLILSKNAVPVDTLKAITDDDYFIKYFMELYEVNSKFGFMALRKPWE